MGFSWLGRVGSWVRGRAYRWALVAGLGLSWVAAAGGVAYADLTGDFIAAISGITDQVLALVMGALPVVGVIMAVVLGMAIVMGIIKLIAYRL